MSLRARGRHRFGVEARPNDITLTRRNKYCFVSVTMRVPDDACARQRTSDARRGVDFGINDWATFDDGQSIANSRRVREELPRLAALQRSRARKKSGRRASSALASASRGCMIGSRTCGATSCTSKHPAWCSLAPCW